MHLIVLFLLHLSLQHLAEIRFLRKRNVEMESELVVQVCLYGLREAPIPSTSLGSSGRSFFARSSKPFSSTTCFYLFSAFLFSSFRAWVMLPRPPLLGWHLLLLLPLLGCPLGVPPRARPSRVRCWACASGRGHAARRCSAWVVSASSAPFCSVTAHRCCVWVFANV